jgi:hypothetical protein
MCHKDIGWNSAVAPDSKLAPPGAAVHLIRFEAAPAEELAGALISA